MKKLPKNKKSKNTKTAKKKVARKAGVGNKKTKPTTRKKVGSRSKLKRQATKSIRGKKNLAVKKERILDPFEPTLREELLLAQKKATEKVETVEKFLIKPDTDKINKDVLAINKIKENLKKLSDTPSQESQFKKNIFRLSLMNFLQLIILPFKKIGIAIFSSLRIALIKHKIKKKQLIKDIEEEIDDIFAPRVKFLGIILPYGWQKALVTFLVILMLLILPFSAIFYLDSLYKLKGNVVSLSHQAYQHLERAQLAIYTFDLDQASNEFESAAKDFNQAKKEIDNLNFFTLAILKTIPQAREPMSAGLNLLSAGQNISNAGYYLLKGINSFLQDKHLDLTQKFSVLNYDLSLALIEVAKAQEDISQVDLNNLNQFDKQTVTLASSELPKVENKLSEFSVLSQMVLKFLGQDQWQRYLLIFQNNNEIRATGGFMGSYALLDIDQGRIKNLEIPAGGTYDLQGSLKVAVASPKPLQLINPRWEFQDANWWPDFPTTAKKIIWFYENADGPTVDGVIAVTSSFMEDLLALTGPIAMPEYNRVITADNFESETQNIVELEYDREENKPKQFLADFAPKIFESFTKLNQQDLLKLIEIFYQNLQEKNIMFYFPDPQLEDLVLAFNWGGQMQDTTGDYLAVISTNIAGAKTDAVIETRISHQAQVLEDNSIIDTVTVTKRHKGEKGNIFTGVQNNDYLRIYVPQGSQLLEVQGFSQIDSELFESTEGLEADFDLALVETDSTLDSNSNTRIYNESGKTVFANWFQIKPGEEKSVSLRYKLPFKLNSNYSLLVQKQAGKDNIEFSSLLTSSQELNIQNIYPSQIIKDQNSLYYHGILNKDLFYGFTLTE